MKAATVPAAADAPLRATAGLRKAFPASSAQPFQFWIHEGEPDEVTKAKDEFSSWLKQIAKNELLFDRYVYKNENLSMLDLHQHRARLFEMLANGENLIVKFVLLGNANKIDPSNYFKLIEENLEQLLVAFNAWHGPLEAQEDIPEDFKEGIRDIEEGKIVDLDQALTEKPLDGA